MATLGNKNSFRATFGVAPGYGEQAETKSQALGLPAISMVAEAWNVAALEVEKAYGLYIPAVLNESRTIYKLEWGCPPGGEVTVTVTGCYNLVHNSAYDLLFWQHSVRRTVEVTKELLKQTTVTLEWFEIEVEYISNRVTKEPTG